MTLTSAKCPQCAANITVPKENEISYCIYCGARVVVKETIEVYKVRVIDDIKVKGICDIDDKIRQAEAFVKLKKFSKAREVYKQISNDYPSDWRGWWGYCRFYYYRNEANDRNPAVIQYQGLEEYSIVMRIVGENQSLKGRLLDEYKAYFRDAYINQWTKVPGAFPFELAYGVDSFIKRTPNLPDPKRINDISKQNGKELNKRMRRCVGILGWFSDSVRRKRQRRFVQSILDTDAVTSYNKSDYEHLDAKAYLFFERAIGKTVFCRSYDTDSDHTDYFSTFSFPSKELFPFPEIEK